MRLALTILTVFVWGCGNAPIYNDCDTVDPRTVDLLVQAARNDRDAGISKSQAVQFVDEQCYDLECLECGLSIVNAVWAKQRNISTSPQDWPRYNVIGDYVGCVVQGTGPESPTKRGISECTCRLMAFGEADYNECKCEMGGPTGYRPNGDEYCLCSELHYDCTPLTEQELEDKFWEQQSSE